MPFRTWIIEFYSAHNLSSIFVYTVSRIYKYINIYMRMLWCIYGWFCFEHIIVHTTVYNHGLTRPLHMLCNLQSNVPDVHVNGISRGCV